jgi:hypothetical protein
MSTSRLLRIASVISLIFTAGHTVGGLQQWFPRGNNPVLTSMTDVRFDTMGANRSYLDFFMGFGWSISVLMLMETVLLWQLALVAATEPVRLRPMIAIIALAAAGIGIVAWRFILPLPALFSAALVIALGFAYATARLDGHRHWFKVTVLRIPATSSRRTPGSRDHTQMELQLRACSFLAGARALTQTQTAPAVRDTFENSAWPTHRRGIARVSYGPSA